MEEAKFYLILKVLSLVSSEDAELKENLELDQIQVGKKAWKKTKEPELLLTMICTSFRI